MHISEDLRLAALDMALRHMGGRDPDVTIGGKDDPYLLRWHLIPHSDHGNCYLHLILRDDDDRALHDHPWDSVSILLRGGYTEHLFSGAKRRHAAGDVVMRKAADTHRLSLWRLSHGKTISCVSLFLTGPKVREWGFWCPHGWVHWRDFTKPGSKGEIGAGCLAPAGAAP